MSWRTKILFGISLATGLTSIGIAVVTGNWILPVWNFHKIISAIGIGTMLGAYLSHKHDEEKTYQANMLIALEAVVNSKR